MNVIHSLMSFLHLTHYTAIVRFHLLNLTILPLVYISVSVNKNLCHFMLFRYKRSMSAHLKVECGKEPQLPCPYCPHRSKKNHHLVAHIRAIHKDII
jgi:hypothetical protein